MIPYALSLELRLLQKDDDAVMVFSGNAFRQKLKSLVCCEVLVDSLGKKNTESHWQQKPLWLF